MYTTFKDAKEFADTFPVGSKIRKKAWYNSLDQLTVNNIYYTTNSVELITEGKSVVCNVSQLVKEVWELVEGAPLVKHSELEVRCQHDYRVYQGFMRKQEEYEMVCFKCGEGK